MWTGRRRRRVGGFDWVWSNREGIGPLKRSLIPDSVVSVMFSLMGEPGRQEDHTNQECEGHQRRLGAS